MKTIKYLHQFSQLVNLECNVSTVDQIATYAELTNINQQQHTQCADMQI
ncbi:hypothetical protein LC593_17740 [Nostoc sp. CHAB 5844]|nr:hypothetical protein [Nostoc sp. CHAB 5844]